MGNQMIMAVLMSFASFSSGQRIIRNIVQQPYDVATTTWPGSSKNRIEGKIHGSTPLHDWTKRIGCPGKTLHIHIWYQYHYIYIYIYNWNHHQPSPSRQLLILLCFVAGQGLTQQGQALGEAWGHVEFMESDGKSIGKWWFYGGLMAI